MNPIIDEYGILKTSSESCAIIASLINNNGRLLVSWTDEEGTQLDILFTTLDQRISHPLAQPQGGIKSDYLFVSIMRMGAFAFEINKSFTHPNTYAEKLGVDYGGVTANKLADLINGVKIALTSLK